MLFTLQPAVTFRARACDCFLELRFLCKGSPLLLGVQIHHTTLQAGSERINSCSPGCKSLHTGDRTTEKCFESGNECHAHITEKVLPRPWQSHLCAGAISQLGPAFVIVSFCSGRRPCSNTILKFTGRWLCKGELSWSWKST